MLSNESSNECMMTRQRNMVFSWLQGKKGMNRAESRGLEKTLTYS